MCQVTLRVSGDPPCVRCPSVGQVTLCMLEQAATRLDAPNTMLCCAVLLSPAVIEVMNIKIQQLQQSQQASQAVAAKA